MTPHSPDNLGWPRKLLRSGSFRPVFLILSVIIIGLPLSSHVATASLTWNPPETTVPTQYPDIVNLNPSAALAPDGSIWLVWESYSPVVVSNTARIMMKQTLLGYPDLTWSNDLNVTQNPGRQPDKAPHITRLANGTMMVVWSREGPERGLYYRLNTGGNWSPEARLTYGPVLDKNPSLVQDQKGRVWVAWDRSNPESVVYDTNGNGLYDTGEPVLVGTTPVVGAVLKTDPPIKYVNATNSPSETWTPGKTVVYNSKNDGIYDASDTVLAGATPAAGTRLGSDSKIKYFDALNINYWYYLPPAAYYKFFDGTFWSNDIQLTFDPSYNQKPDITQTRDGRMWIVWQSNRVNRQYDIFYKTLNGTTWSPDTILFNDSVTTCAAPAPYGHPVGCDDLDPDMIQDRNGTIQIFWSRAQPTVLSPNSFPGEIFTISSADNGITFPMSNMQQMTFNNQLTQCPPPDPCTINAQSDNAPAAVEFNRRLWVFWNRPNASTPDVINLYDMPSNTIFTHDVDITSVTRPDKAIWNTTFQLNITVVNKGDFPENATVTWNIGTVASGTCTTPFTISPGGGRNCLVPLKYENTAVLKPGRYPITALATIPQEPPGNLPDNKFGAGTITLLPPGDMDSDGDVTLLDAIIWIQSYGSRPGSPNWNPVADLNGDGVVDFKDSVILARWLGTRI